MADWKRLTPKRREELNDYVQNFRPKLNQIASKRERFAFGHGFVWAYITYKGYRSKQLLGSIDGRSDWDGILKEIEELDGVEFAYINAD